MDSRYKHAGMTKALARASRFKSDASRKQRLRALDLRLDTLGAGAAGEVAPGKRGIPVQPLQRIGTKLKDKMVNAHVLFVGQPGKDG